MDIPKFRTEFPEFSDTSVYPTPMIEFWSVLAEKQVVETVWGDVRPTGVKLYVAHEITLAAQNKKAAAVGGTPGSQGGIANSKTVGSVTVGYDSQNTSEKNGGYWNLTNYGKQFIRLARMFGSYGIQL
jgi:hypothetical protein